MVNKQRLIDEFLELVQIDSPTSKEGKIAELIVSGILKENKNKKYEVIFDEQEALIKAISMARSGDTIVVFFEQMNPLVKIIEEFNSFYKENEELRYNALK